MPRQDKIKNLRILGIDPGYDRLGIAIVEKSAAKSTEKERVIYSDCFETSAKDHIYDRFKAIGLEVSGIIDKFKPGALAIETLFITKNQKTGMRVAEARGIIMYEAIRRGLPIFEYSPTQIKTAVSGDGHMDKEHMAKMIGLLVELPQKGALDDEYDAIAVALTHLAVIHNPAFLQK